MTLEIDGIDVIQLAQAASVIGGIAAALIVGFLIYLLVRPPRHVREARHRPAELQESEVEEMIGLIDRMERRLELLERSLADRTEITANREHLIPEMAEEGQQSRRTK